MTDHQPRDVHRLSRRDLVKVAALGAVGLAAGYGGTAALTRMGEGEAPRFHFLTDAEGALLTEVCERIVPRDDMPGATDAGVVFYLDRQLVGAMRKHRKIYRAGLEALGQTCAKLHQQPFAALPAEKKDEVLRLMEGGKAPKDLWGDTNQQGFFRLVCTHTMHGFYGSPRHGGNKHYVSFRMLGIPYPQVIGRNV